MITFISFLNLFPTPSSFFFLDINYTWLKYLRNHDHHHFLSSFFYFGITLDKNSDYFIQKMRGRREKHVAYYRSDIHWVLSIWILMFVLRAFTYIQMFRLNKSKCNIVCQDILCTCNHSSRCVYIFFRKPSSHLQYSLKQFKWRLDDVDNVCLNTCVKRELVVQNFDISKILRHAI